MRGVPLLGVLSALRHDAPNLLLDAHRQHGDVVELQVPLTTRLIALRHPHAVRRVLVERSDSFRRSPFHARLEPILGRGLLTSEPPLWNAQRALIQPAFHGRALRHYAGLMASEAEELAESWNRAGAAEWDASRAFSDLALAVATKSLFGRDANHAQIAEAVETVREVLAARMFAPVPLPLWLPTAAHRRLKRARRRLDLEVERIVKASTDSEESLTARLGSNDRMQSGLLRDEVMTLFLAGHETSAVGLAWAAFLLGQEPEWQERLAEEADRAWQSTDDATIRLDRLPWCKAAVLETLRLYPPAAWFARGVQADETIDGFALPARSVVLISPYVTQRDPRWWPEPERFLPERFAETAAKPAPLTFFPFGAGPRTCIGLQFALNEIVLSLAALVRRVRFSTIDHATTRAESAITLRPSPALRLEVRPRA